MTANNYTLLQGDSAAVLKGFPANHFDSIVTDPPYGIDFLGKSWDANTGTLELYQECLRVLKPGGHLLAFSAARTYHHLAYTVERAGFEIRDQIMWLYSSGFPKSQDVGRSIQRNANRHIKPVTLDPATLTRTKNPNPNVRDKKGDSLYSGGFQKGDTAIYTDARGKQYTRVGEDQFKEIPASRTRKGAVTGNDILNGGFKGGTEKSGEFNEVAITDPTAQQWSGWGTALKPAHEPIVVARKPLKLSVTQNVQVHGTGALNIDAARIPATDLKEGTMGKAPPNLNAIGSKSEIETSEEPWIPSELGRFPSNVIGEVDGYQKYFYCPKVSRRERHIGFEGVPARVCGAGGSEFVQAQDHQRSNTDIPTTREMLAEMGGYYTDSQGRELTDGVGSDVWVPHIGLFKAHGVKHEYEQWHKMNGTQPRTPGNNHPTVKPQQLMEYLIRLVTPPGGRVLDPFNGSGSTGMAAVKLGHEYVGIDLDPKYIEISRRRIEAWNQPEAQDYADNTYDNLFESAES